MDNDVEGTVHLKKKVDILRNAMWKKIQVRGGYIGLFFSITNLLVQLDEIRNLNKDDQDKLVNIIYAICITVSLILYLIAYCKSKTFLIFPAYFILALTTGMKLIDFENSRS